MLRDIYSSTGVTFEITVLRVAFSYSILFLPEFMKWMQFMFCRPNFKDIFNIIFLIYIIRRQKVLAFLVKMTGLNIFSHCKFAK